MPDMIPDTKLSEPLSIEQKQFLVHFFFLLFLFCGSGLPGGKSLIPLSLAGLPGLAPVFLT